MKIKTVIGVVAAAFAYLMVIASAGTYIDSIEYEVQNREPVIVSAKASVIELDELPGNIEWDSYYDEDYMAVKVDYELYNPSNTCLYLNGSVASYDAETERGYCSVLDASDSGLLVREYYYCDILPSDCTAVYPEYVRVPKEASHLVIDVYQGSKKKPLEMVVVLE